jgi:hypothetical protein
MVCAIVPTVDVYAADYFDYFGPSGGRGGAPFLDRQLTGAPLITLRVWGSGELSGIQTDLGAIPHSIIGALHGKKSGPVQEITYQAPGKRLVKISGYADNVVRKLSFTFRMVNDPQLETITFGDADKEDNFRYDADTPGKNIEGFLGRSGSRIDTIGVIVHTHK